MAQTNSRFFSLMVVGEEPEKIIDKYSMEHKCEPYVKYKYLDAKKYQAAAIKTLTKLLEESDKIGISPTVAEQLDERLKVLNSLSPFEYYRELTDGMYYNEDGDALSEENKEGKYNTCRKGGHFSMPLILMDGSETYQAYTRDIDWDKMNNTNAEIYKAAWEMVMEDREPITGEEKQIYESMKDKEPYFENFASKEEYVARSTAYWNYAYVDKDGWVSVDECSSEIDWIKNFYDRFITKLNDNDLITIFECSVNNG